jgi:sugar lactone lactonase YvrE
MKYTLTPVLLCLATVPAFAQDIALSAILLPNEPWQVVEEGMQDVQGMTADRAGGVYVSAKAGKGLVRVGTTRGFKIATIGETEGSFAGLACGADDRIYACQPEKRRIVTLADGKVSTVAEDLAARDLVVTRAGAIYCTVPAEKAVYLVMADGKKRVVDQTIAAPSGIALWPDQGTLVVGDGGSLRLWTFRIDKDGGLSAKDDYYLMRRRPPESTGGATALTVDATQLTYATAAAGVYVWDPTGRLSGVILAPAQAPVTALTFGGAAHDQLFVACGDKVYARKLQRKGVLTRP